MGIATRWAGGCAAAALLAVSSAACGSSTPASPTTPAGPTVNATTITITSSGVTPVAIAIAPGTQVTYVNNDTRNHNVTSNPHPDHTDCPAINQVGVLVPGQSRQTGNLNTVRTCGYHDHDDAENNRWKGTITIQ
jgi:plastocyanin